VIGAFDLADALLHGPGKGAPFVTEQLAFEQRLGNGGAVDRDERRADAPAHFMDCLSEQFLSGTALTEQQYRYVCRRYLSMSRNTRNISTLPAIIPSTRDVAAPSANRRFSASSSNICSARLTISCSTSMSIGF